MDVTCTLRLYVTYTLLNPVDYFQYDLEISHLIFAIYMYMIGTAIADKSCMLNMCKEKIYKIYTGSGFIKL